MFCSFANLFVDFELRVSDVPITWLSTVCGCNCSLAFDCLRSWLQYCRWSAEHPREYGSASVDSSLGSKALVAIEDVKSYCL